MKKRTLILSIKSTIIWILILLPFSSLANKPPFTVSPGLFDHSLTKTLGLNYPEKSHTFTVYHAENNTNKYNHGAVLMPFKGQLFIQWQSSRQDEDAADTQIFFSTSTDAQTWNKAKVLMPARDNATVTNGGWWTDGETLIAFINVWPKNLTPRGGYVEYITSVDGHSWSTPQCVKYSDGRCINGVIEQDLRQLANGRILTALHQQPGLIAKPIFTDDPLALSGWKLGNMDNLPHKKNISRELEPSWYMKRDSSIVMIFRDQESSFRTLAAVSKDNGVTWSQAIETNMFDSRAKQSAGNLPDGSAFIINNPTGTKQRIPLVVNLSDNGVLFDRAFLLNSGDDLPLMKYQGKYKRIGFSYPKSIIWQNYLLVSYALNKEDIVVTKVPLSSLN